MIPAAAVDDFLDRDLDNHTWIKSVSEDKLDREIARLRPRPDLWPELRIHQKACFLLGVAYPQFCFWLDMGCVDGDTEYLSPEGWVPIREYVGGPVAQYDPRTRRAEFVLPSRYVDRPCERMYHFKTARGCDQMLSPGHKMLVVGGGVHHGPKCTRWAGWKNSPVCSYNEGRNEWFFDTTPEEIAGRSHVRFDTTFHLDGPGIDLTDDQIRLQVAVHADGHLHNRTTTVVSVKKKRKRLRMRWLLAAAGVPYKIRTKPGGYEVFVFRAPIHSKLYGPEWYQCSLAQKEVICGEVVHWDGAHTKAGGASFFSRSLSCADFVQFCFSSTGRRAFLGSSKPDAMGKIDHTVHAIGTGRTTNLAHLGKYDVVPAPGGRMYCFEVPTGYLVFRRNGNVFVSGNTGKTLLSLELLRYWWNCGRLRRALIFVTSDKAFLTWEAQMRRFDIGLPFAALEGSSANKWRTLEELGEGLALVTYPGAVAMTVRTVPGKKGKRRQKIDPGLAADLREWAGGIIMDESTRVGHTNLAHQLINKIKRDAVCRYALAGRPLGRDPTLLHGQYKLVDDGQTLGETLGLFRAAFFSEHKIPWDRSGRAREYKFCKSMRPDLARMMQHRSIAYSADECIDLPEAVPIAAELSFPVEAETYYKKVVKELIAARGNFRAVESAFLRMRQISSGFIGVRDDLTGDKAEIEFADNPKLDWQLDQLDNLPEGRKAVVFYEFNYSGRRLQEELRSRGIGSIRLWGGTEDHRKELTRFMSRPECEVALVNNKVGAYSLDGLQHVANYTFFYESPVSPIDREQAERRLERDGQEHRVMRYDPVVRGSADRRILQFHAEGEEMMDALVRDPSRALEEDHA